MKTKRISKNYCETIKSKMTCFFMDLIMFAMFLVTQY